MYFFIRTLYCAKGNYEFGISRVIKSLEPYQKKLGTDTWFYTKRCFLSLIENMSKHMIMLRDNVIMECIQFLEHCESACMIVQHITGYININVRVNCDSGFSVRERREDFQRA